MLKTISTLCDILLTIAFGFALWSLTMVYAQAVEAKYWFFPEFYVTVSQGLLEPCAKAVEASIGPHTSTYGTHTIRVAYGVMGCIGIVIGSVFLAISSCITSLHNKVMAFAKNMKEQQYAQRAQREREQKSKAVGRVPVGPQDEHCALLGVHLDNLEFYPHLQRAVEKKLDGYSSNTLLYAGETRLLLKARSTMAAVDMVEEFKAFYQQASRTTALQVGKMPSLRFVIHSVQSVHSIPEEDGLVQSLLNCAGANQVFLSPAAKEQYTLQNGRRTTPFRYNLHLLGTFSVQNHPLERVDVYKLS